MGYIIDVSQSIWRIVFSETLTSADLRQLAKEAAEIETNTPVVASRLVDLRELCTITVGFSEVGDLAAARRSLTLPNSIRSALLVSNPVQLGYARMFQTLLEHPQIEVRVFSDEKDALVWLSGGSR